MALPKRSKGGQPAKGPRRLVATRLPDDLADDLIRRADESGLTISDYAALVIATALDHPVPDYVLKKIGNVDQLPLGA